MQALLFPAHLHKDPEQEGGEELENNSQVHLQQAQPDLDRIKDQGALKRRQLDWDLQSPDLPPSGVPGKKPRHFLQPTVHKPTPDVPQENINDVHKIINTFLGHDKRESDLAVEFAQ